MRNHRPLPSIGVLFPRPLDPDDLFQLSSKDLLAGLMRAPAGCWAWLEPLYFDPYLQRVCLALGASSQKAEFRKVDDPPRYVLGPNSQASLLGVLVPEPVPMTIERLARLMASHQSSDRVDAFFRFFDLALQDIPKARVNAAIEAAGLTSLVR